MCERLCRGILADGGGTGPSTVVGAEAFSLCLGVLPSQPAQDLTAAAAAVAHRRRLLGTGSDPWLGLLLLLTRHPAPLHSRIGSNGPQMWCRRREWSFSESVELPVRPAEFGDPSWVYSLTGQTSAVSLVCLLEWNDAAGRWFQDFAAVIPKEPSPNTENTHWRISKAHLRRKWEPHGNTT